MCAAIRLLMLGGLASAAACNRQPQQQNQDVAITNVPAGADVETLPADESSETPSNQLVNGNDNPDVNESTNNGD
jgi:hypothetical protein